MRIVAGVLALIVAAIGGEAGPADRRGTVRVGLRPYAGAVVWLDPQTAAAAPAPARAVLSQRNLTFEPHVLAVRVGTTVDLPNNDRVFHNVFSFHDGKRFDLGLYPVGTSKQLTFDRAGVSRIFCNIHPGMAAYVLAVDTPFFAVSDSDGRFSIPAVPPGAYTYHAWRAGGATLTGSLAADPDTSFDLQWP
jgi:plastocyanin